jgi:hypothetical protein
MSSVCNCNNHQQTIHVFRCIKGQVGQKSYFHVLDRCSAPQAHSAPVPGTSSGGVALYDSIPVLLLPRILNPKAPQCRYARMHTYKYYAYAYASTFVYAYVHQVTPHLFRFSFSSCRFALFLRGHDCSTIACLSKIDGHTHLAAFSC